MKIVKTTIDIWRVTDDDRYTAVTARASLAQIALNTKITELPGNVSVRVSDKLGGPTRVLIRDNFAFMDGEQKLAWMQWVLETVTWDPKVNYRPSTGQMVVERRDGVRLLFASPKQLVAWMEATR